MTCMAGTCSSNMLFNKVLLTDHNWSTVSWRVKKNWVKKVRKISLGGINISSRGNMKGVHLHA